MKKITLFLALSICLTMCFVNCSKDDDKDTVQTQPNTLFNIDDYIGTYNSTETMSGSIEIIGQISQFPEAEPTQSVLTLKKGDASNKIIMTEDTGEEMVGTLTDSNIVFETQTMDMQEIFALISMAPETVDEETLEMLRNTTGTITLATTGSLSNKKNFNFDAAMTGTMYISTARIIIPCKMNMQVVGTAEKQTSSVAKSTKGGNKSFRLWSIIRLAEKARLIAK